MFKRDDADKIIGARSHSSRIVAAGPSVQGVNYADIVTPNANTMHAESPRSNGSSKGTSIRRYVHKGPGTFGNESDPGRGTFVLGVGGPEFNNKIRPLHDSLDGRLHGERYGVFINANIMGVACAFQDKIDVGIEAGHINELKNCGLYGAVGGLGVGGAWVGFDPLGGEVVGKVRVGVGMYAYWGAQLITSRTPIHAGLVTGSPLKL